MSILSEILQSGSKKDANDLLTNLPDLERNVEQLTKDVSTHVENVYVKYTRINNTNNTILNEVINYQLQLQDLHEKAEFIKDKELDIEDVSRSVAKLQIIDSKVQYLMSIKDALQSFDQLDLILPCSSFLKCAEIILELRNSINFLSQGGVIFDAIKSTLQRKEFIVVETMKTAFKKNVELIEDTNKQKTILKLKKPNPEIQEIISALYILKKEVAPLHQVAKDLWVHVFLPLVNYEVTLTKKEDKNECVSLELMITSPDKSTYDTVFDNLHTVLNFLKDNFTYKVTDDMPALEYIGGDIRDNLSELIIKKCLRDTIPSQVADLERFDVVKQATEALEKSLLDAHLFNKDTMSILEYANNVDVLFINKKCDEYIKSAKEIIKKDLHDLMEVSDDAKSPVERELKFSFPVCCISKNVDEFLKFCESILQLAVESSPESSGRLFVTVTNILSMYRSFVPDQHKTYLTTLPQQIAVFLNNCLYIRYTLINWEAKYCKRLQPILHCCTFAEEIEAFPKVGQSFFGKYLEAQIKQIEEIMDGAQLNGSTIDKLEPKTEKCIRQCLRQQELLRTVWHKVLPIETYNKNVGLLVNALAKTIIDPVVKFEDISAKAAEELVDVIKLVLTRAPKLFIDSNEVTLYVSLWNKLNELSFVLNASLLDIDDRWASGKGPLALYFEPLELKQLIKALFQNTDRRAQVLSRIIL